MATEKIIIDKSDLRSLLAEGFHTAFRKATDCEQALAIWKLIRDMPNKDWGRVLDFVMDGIGTIAVPVQDESFIIDPAYVPACGELTPHPGHGDCEGLLGGTNDDKLPTLGDV